MTQFLIEIVGKNKTTMQLKTFRFCEGPGGYNTEPADDPPNAHFMPRINQPGAFTRNLFGASGSTTGQANVDKGEILLNNTDGRLDELKDYAFDGYNLSIIGLPNEKSPWSERVTYFSGTIEQSEVTWSEIRLQLRSKLLLLDKKIQELVYSGTSVNATIKTAEGDVNLKNTPRVLGYGAMLQIAPVLLHANYNVYGVNQSLSSISEVRVKGVLIPYSNQDFTTVEALINATITNGQYASARNLGLIRFNTLPDGIVTVKANEGVNASDRTVGQIVKRILVQQSGFVSDANFLESDIALLDQIAPYEAQYWVGTAEANTLAVVSTILNSVGASIAPDRTGIYRIVQFSGPAQTAKRTFTEVEITEGTGVGIQRLTTGDDGRGIPSKKQIVRYAYNYAVLDEEAIAGTTKESDKPFMTFSMSDWREESAGSDAILDLHKFARDTTTETVLVKLADAQAEAQRRVALYGVERERYEIPLPSQYASQLDLGDTVSIKVSRFGLTEGKNFVIIGIREDYESKTTTLDVWG